MIRAGMLLIVVLLVAACESSIPDQGEADVWSFREGPYGLRCVFVENGSSGSGSNVLAMDCDWSRFNGRWPDVTFEQ